MRLVEVVLDQKFAKVKTHIEGADMKILNSFWVKKPFIFWLERSKTFK